MCDEWGERNILMTSFMDGPQNPRGGDGHFGVVIPICLSPDHLARSVDACLFQRDADIPARGGRQRRQLAEAPQGRAGTQRLQGSVLQKAIQQTVTEVVLQINMKLQSKAIHWQN